MIKKMAICVGVITLVHGCTSPRQRARQCIERAEEFHEAQEWQQAIDACGEALEIDPEYNYAYSVRGLMKYRADHEPVECLKDLDRGLASGGGMQPYFWRAAVRFKAKDYDGVIADCNRSIRYADAKGLSLELIERDRASGKNVVINMGAEWNRHYAEGRDEAVALRNRAQALIPLQSSEP